MSHAQAATPTIPGIVDPHLSAAQQARIKVRNTKFLKERAAILANTHLTPAQKEAKYKALVQSANVDVLAIMTPAQQAVVKKNRDIAMHMQQEQMQRGQAFQQAHKTEFDEGRALTAKLNKSLSPAQNAQIKAIKQEANVQLQHLIADKSLTPQAKQAKLVIIQQDAQNKIQALLNPAQKADAIQLEQLKQKLSQEAQATHGK